jgi:hypothetical protein
MKKVSEYFYSLDEANKFKRNAERAMFAQLDEMHDNPDVLEDYTITIAGHTLVIDPCADNFEAIMGCINDLIKIWEEDNCKDAAPADADGMPSCEDVKNIIEQIMNKDGSFKVRAGEKVNGFEVIEMAEGEGFGMISLGKRREEAKK